jgi:3-deoxy-D-manno-octulosonic-acid transferase
MFPLIYSAALTTLGIVYTPKMLYDMGWQKKYRHSLMQRLGMHWPRLPQGPVIWLHAVSVGETRAIAALAALLAERHPTYSLIVSSMTETGHAEARRLIPQAAAHVFLPLDWKCILYPMLRELDLRLLVISEGDLWWRFMDLCHRQGATIALVNGKLSERSLRRLLWCGPLRRRVCALLDICCVQNATYADRFIQLGVAAGRIHVSGNLKFDPAEKYHTDPSLHAKLALPEPAPPLLVAGSTHEGEEAILLATLAALWHKHPTLRLVLAPRHPERFDAVADLLQHKNIAFCRWSQGCQPEWRVLLIDAMGILPNLYPLAHIAIVGGSFVPGIGGHNIIEPCLTHTPVLFGPHMSTQSEMVTLVQTHHTGQQITDPSQLTAIIDDWLSNPSILASYSARCQTLIQAISGTTERTYQHLHCTL